MTGRIDLYSETWASVLQWAASEIERARIANDSAKNTGDETMVLRGEIKALKKLLALADPPKERLRPVDDLHY